MSGINSAWSEIHCELKEGKTGGVGDRWSTADGKHDPV